jgi:hypothetical protein
MQKINRNNLEKTVKVIEHLDPMCKDNLTLSYPGISPCLCNSTTPATVSTRDKKILGVTYSQETIYYCPVGTQNGK